MVKVLLSCAFVLILHDYCGAQNIEQLVQNRRSFTELVDESKLNSYLASFGASPRQENDLHERVKRSPAIRKMRKGKKVSTTTEESIPLDFSEKVLTLSEKPKNFTITPRQILKFEVNDAKYSEDYEKLKKSRKLRVKRDTDDQESSNNRERFMQPKDLLRFSLSDAVIRSSAREQTENSEKKIKREASASSSTESKKIRVTSPMRNHRSARHVKYEDLPSKLQKLISDAIHDAVQSGKASNGDFLKFYYGDKIIKVPVLTSKYAQHKPKEQHAKEQHKVSFKSENLTVAELPKLLGTKNTYYQLKTSAVKYEAPPTTEKAESYANFKSPIMAQPETPDNKYLPYKKSVYYYTNGEVYYGNFPAKTSSPDPVLFEDATTPSSHVVVEPSKPSHYPSYVVHPSVSTQLSSYKEAIPITETVDESYIPYKPQESLKFGGQENVKFEGLGSYSTHKAPAKAPSSYVEYHGSHPETHDYAKNYEFGYHISDYKSGNNFAHSQKKVKDETVGQYSILLPDGRVQKVTYIANDSGFHADVSYENVH